MRKKWKRKEIEKTCLVALALSCQAYSPDNFSPVSKVVFTKHMSILQANRNRHPEADSTVPFTVNSLSQKPLEKYEKYTRILRA